MNVFVSVKNDVAGEGLFNKVTQEGFAVSRCPEKEERIDFLIFNVTSMSVHYTSDCGNFITLTGCYSDKDQSYRWVSLSEEEGLLYVDA